MDDKFERDFDEFERKFTEVFDRYEAMLDKLEDSLPKFYAIINKSIVTNGGKTNDNPCI